jgi:hypothetical protein
VSGVELDKVWKICPAQEQSGSRIKLYDPGQNSWPSWGLPAAASSTLHAGGPGGIARGILRQIAVNQLSSRTCIACLQSTPCTSA